MKDWMQRAINRYLLLWPQGTQPLAREDLPPPMVGQVWAERAEDGEVSEHMIVCVYRDGARIGYRLWYNAGGSPSSPSRVETEWPPLNAALIAGPGSPWAPE